MFNPSSYNGFRKINFRETVETLWLSCQHKEYLITKLLLEEKKNLVKRPLFNP